jgi:hypothetical protein
VDGVGRRRRNRFCFHGFSDSQDRRHLTILALTLARIIWRLANPAPALPDGMSRIERFAASVTHLGFYAFLIAVPLSGWAMASVSPTGVPTFFLLMDVLPFAHLPLLGDAGLTERHTAEAFLEKRALLSGARHGPVDRFARRSCSEASVHRQRQSDRPHGYLCPIRPEFHRQSQRWRHRGGGSADVSGRRHCLGYRAIHDLSAGHSRRRFWGADLGSTPDAWVIDHAASSLGFTITYTGNDVAGTIGSWTGDILFDPSDLEVPAQPSPSI